MKLRKFILFIPHIIACGVGRLAKFIWGLQERGVCAVPIPLVMIGVGRLSVIVDHGYGFSWIDVALAGVA